MEDGRMRIEMIFPSEDACVYAERALRYAGYPEYTRPSESSIITIIESRKAPLLAELLKWAVGSASYDRIQFITSEYVDEQ